MKISIAILGIGGKMGKTLSSLALKDPSFSIVGGFEKKDSPLVGKDIGLWLENKPINALIEDQLENIAKKADILIDFSSPSLLPELLKVASKEQKALLIGTTGYTKKDLSQLHRSAKKIPILYSTNFSMGIAICKELLSKIPSFFAEESDIDIVEEHHIKKKDSPSGTALTLAKTLQASYQKQPSLHSLRAGALVGTHTIYFTSEKERLTLRHEAFSRDIFAQGALKAAKFLWKKPPGLYSIEDLFRLCNQ